jgi:hypothetical protein
MTHEKLRHAIQPRIQPDRPPKNDAENHATVRSPIAARDASPPVDYDLHGLVGIRLHNASPRDAAMVARQLGLSPTPLAREPDIRIRFVDHLPGPSPMRLLDLENAGYGDDAFLLLRAKTRDRKQARVQIAFDQIGDECEIICEKGITLIPLLVPILNLTVLAKGYIPLHAAAFTFEGTGVLVSGWAKGGKSETLLAFAANGANYLGDEWIYLSPDGKEMYGMPMPIRMLEWLLQELPHHQSLLDRRERMRLWAVRRIVASLDWAMSSPMRHIPLVAGIAERIKPLFKHQLYTTLSPRKLFGERMGPLSGSFDKLIFVASHDSPEVIVTPVDPQEIAQRMLFSLEYERQNLLADYLKFRFAFPERQNRLIEQAAALERELLPQALAGKEAYAVYHPYPVSLPALYNAIRPICR